MKHLKDTGLNTLLVVYVLGALIAASVMIFLW